MITPIRWRRLRLQRNGVAARLGREEGIGPKAISQFDSAPKSAHNKVSVEMLDHGTEYRKDILAMPDAFTLTDRLKFRILAIQKCNVLDKLAEGPHAEFKHIALHGRRGTFAWAAASSKLTQNLDQDVHLADALDIPVDEVWLRYKSVLQTDRFWNRNVCCTLDEFQNRLYHCSLTFDPAVDEGHEAFSWHDFRKWFGSYVFRSSFGPNVESCLYTYFAGRFRKSVIYS